MGFLLYANTKKTTAKTENFRKIPVYKPRRVVYNKIDYNRKESDPETPQRAAHHRCKSCVFPPGCASG